MLRGALESINVSACENLHYQEERDVLTDVEIFPIWLTNRRFSVSLQIFSDISLHVYHWSGVKIWKYHKIVVFSVSIVGENVGWRHCATEISQLCCKYPPLPQLPLSSLLSLPSTVSGLASSPRPDRRLGSGWLDFHQLHHESSESWTPHRSYKVARNE